MASAETDVARLPESKRLKLDSGCGILDSSRIISVPFHKPNPLIGAPQFASVEPASLSSTLQTVIHVPKYIQLNYAKHFQLDDAANSTEDLCVLIHTNKLCVLTLAPSHPIVRDQRRPVRIDFQNCDGEDRALSRGQGSRKKGAQFIEDGSVICRIECEDGSCYSIKSRVRGKLLEVNSRLSADPVLLSDKPLSLGYLAVIMPTAVEADSVHTALLDEDTYVKLRFPS